MFSVSGSYSTFDVEEHFKQMKLNSVEHYKPEQMQSYIAGWERARLKKRKELRKYYENQEAYSMGYNHGKHDDTFLFTTFKKKLNYLK